MAIIAVFMVKKSVVSREYGDWLKRDAWNGKGGAGKESGNEGLQAGAL